MQKYIVTGAALHLGSHMVLGLSKAQFDDRRHNLDLVKATKEIVICRTRTSVQFKPGESIHLDADPDKMMAESLATPDGRPAKEALAGRDLDRLRAEAEVKARQQAVSTAQATLVDAQKAYAAAEAALDVMAGDDKVKPEEKAKAETDLQAAAKAVETADAVLVALSKDR